MQGLGAIARTGQESLGGPRPPAASEPTTRSPRARGEGAVSGAGGVGEQVGPGVSFSIAMTPPKWPVDTDLLCGCGKTGSKHEIMGHRYRSERPECRKMPTPVAASAAASVPPPPPQTTSPPPNEGSTKSAPDPDPEPEDEDDEDDEVIEEVPAIDLASMPPPPKAAARPSEGARRLRRPALEPNEYAIGRAVSAKARPEPAGSVVQMSPTKVRVTLDLALKTLAYHELAVNAFDFDSDLADLIDQVFEDFFPMCGLQVGAVRSAPAPQAAAG